MDTVNGYVVGETTSFSVFAVMEPSGAQPGPGTLTGTVTSGPTPMNRIVVSAFDAVSHAHVKGVFTTAAGLYTLGLPAGSYHLRFTGTPAGLSQFYDHAARIVSASAVVLEPGVVFPLSGDLGGPINP